MRRSELKFPHVLLMARIFISRRCEKVTTFRTQCCCLIRGGRVRRLPQGVTSAFVFTGVRGSGATLSGWLGGPHLNPQRQTRKSVKICCLLSVPLKLCSGLANCKKIANVLVIAQFLIGGFYLVFVPTRFCTRSGFALFRSLTKMVIAGHFCDEVCGFPGHFYFLPMCVGAA